MKSSVRLFLVFVFSSVCALTAVGSAADIARIEEVVRKVIMISGQYEGKDLVLTAPAPLTDKSGKYFAPYGADGELNAWGKKALEANVGSLAGEKAGGMAVSAAGSVIPGAGLLSPFAKKKSKELGAKAAAEAAAAAADSEDDGGGEGGEGAARAKKKAEKGGAFEPSTDASTFVEPAVDATALEALAARTDVSPGLRALAAEVLSHLRA